MKKWLIALCCIVLAGAVAFVTVVNNKQGQIDTLNKDLSDVQAENNILKEQGEKDAQAIADLNKQVETLTAERDTLTEENGKLTETLDGMNRNLTASQQKMQGILYIMTDGAQGSIDSVLSPYVKIYADVGVDSPYFDAVDYATVKELMEARGEETFGAAEPATLGEMADGLYRIQGKTGTQEEAVAALLETEKAWIAAQTPVTEDLPAAEEAPAAEEPTAETSAEEASAEEAPAAEEPAEEAPAAEEPAAEAPAAEEPAAEAPAEEASAAEEPAEEAATEETAAEVPAAEAPAEEASAAEAPAEEPAAEAPAAEEAPAEDAPAAEEMPAEETAAEVPAEDGTTILTRERLTALCRAVCGSEKEVPAIVFPEQEAEEATRGDLAMVLQALDQLK